MALNRRRGGGECLRKCRYSIFISMNITEGRSLLDSPGCLYEVKKVLSFVSLIGVPGIREANWVSYWRPLAIWFFRSGE